MSTPMTWPAGPAWIAATKESRPAPDPTSTIRSPMGRVRSENGFATPANDSTARSRQRVDDGRVVAELGRQMPPGVELIDRARVNGEGPVVRADAGAQPFGVVPEILGHTSASLPAHIIVAMVALEPDAVRFMAGQVCVRPRGCAEDRA